MGVWSELDGDVLRTIAEEKLSLGDYLRFKSVCKNWKFAIESPPLSRKLRPQLPWLMLPYCRNHQSHSSSSSNCRCFYDISDGKTHHMEFPPGFEDKRCVGSSHGWLIVLEETSPLIFLLNPLTLRRIELPPLSSFPDILGFHADQPGREYLVTSDTDEDHFSLLEMAQYHLNKIVLSCDPTHPNCIAVALYGLWRRLAYCRVGQDHNWTRLIHHDGSYQEVIFWKGAYYAAGYTGSLLVFTPNTSFGSPTVDVIIQRDLKKEISHTGTGRYYLVADSLRDELLLICKDIDWYDQDHYKTFEIHVHSLNEEKKHWEKKQSLGGKVLFLGYNYTLSFSAADYPQVKPNTIYFTDDYLEEYEKGKRGGHDVGIFDMDDGICKPLPCCDPHASFIWPPPMWVTPSLTESSTSST